MAMRWGKSNNDARNITEGAGSHPGQTEGVASNGATSSLPGNAAGDHQKARADRQGPGHDARREAGDGPETRLTVDPALFARLEAMLKGLHTPSPGGLPRLAEVATSILQVAALGIVVVFVVMAGAEIYSDYRLDRVLIDPILVPEALAEHGYTSEAVTNRLRDEIERISQRVERYTNDDGASAEKSTPERTKRGDYVAPVSRKEAIATAAAFETLPDVKIPEAGLSFRAVVDLVDRFLRVQPRRISGEITIVQNSPPSEAGKTSPSDPELRLRSPSPSATAAPTHLFVVVRVEAGDQAQTLEEFVAVDDPEVAIAEASEDALRLIDPYIAALDAFQRDDINTAISEFHEALQQTSNNAIDIRNTDRPCGRLLHSRRPVYRTRAIPASD